ncbi:MAG: phosphoribosylglycinamide formyltransferase [Candidatus Promineifilaceae bacterium]
MGSSPRVIVLISGAGSNLQALIDASAAGRLEAEITLVVSNRLTAYGLERARNAGIETLYFPLKPYRIAGEPRETYDAELAARLLPYEPDLVVLAGWMHVLSPAFLDCFPGQVINLHPALPGQFDGVDGIERAFEAFERGEITYSGCMVHYAVPLVDAGPVILQQIVPFEEGDLLEDFALRMHAAEHFILVEAARQALAERSRPI